MAFKGEIRKVRPLELLECSRIASICFEYQENVDMTPEEKYEKVCETIPIAQHRSAAYPLDAYVAEYDNVLVSTIAAMPFEVNFDGNNASMCGIGGVSTLPQYRRLGSVRAIFNQMLHDEKEKGTEFGYLYPFSQAYYEKFGYYMSEPKIEYTCGLSHLNKINYEGRIDLYDGKSEIEGFQQAYAKMNEYNPQNFMVIRERCDFGKILNAVPCKENKYAYLFSNDKGEAEGYIVFHREKEGNTLAVDELCYDGRNTLLGIMGFVAGFASDYKEIRFEMPVSNPVDFICTDQAQCKFEKKILKNGMLRVIDVLAVLKKAKYIGSGEAVIEVEDNILNHIYRVALRYKDGVLIDIDKTDRKADISLPIGLFSAAIAGRFSSKEWEWMHGEPLPLGLEGVFYKKDIYINNYF